MSFIKKIDEESNVFDDAIAFVQHWDFSRSNTNDESRIEAITTVASICYDNPNVIGKENLYNRLKAEAMGLPSSSFEFVPVLIELGTFELLLVDQAIKKYSTEDGMDPFILNVERYGEWIYDKGIAYLLTNYRALLADHETLKNIHGYTDITQIYNTPSECKIILENSTTFLYKMDMNTSKQHNRHRVSLQELSRRYVSGKKTEFEFYYSKGMKNLISYHYEKEDERIEDVDYEEADYSFTTKELHQMCIDHYFTALENKVQPQEARRILPQSMYTTIWSTFLPFQLDNYLALRDDSHAQQEIRWLAQAMKRLLGLK